ncbi:hypothetical protein MMC13_001111 [Lambiella insularis]|nr:hypothetical protein [Lambiella insularis]
MAVKVNPEITNRNVFQSEFCNAGRNGTSQNDKFRGSSEIKSDALARPVSEILSKEDAGSKSIGKARLRKTPSEATRKSERQQALNQSKQARTPILPGENQPLPDSSTIDCRADLRSCKVQKTTASSSSPGRRAVAASRPSGHDLLKHLSSSERDKSDDGGQQTPGSNTILERLTSKNLKRGARKSDSQQHKTHPKQWGFINMARTRSKSSKSKQTTTASDGSSTTSSSSKSVSTTDPQFARMAEENGILDRFDSIDPVNFDEVRTRLEQSRNSPEPDLQEFKDFCKRIQLSQNEQGVAQAIIPLLCRRTSEGYTQIYDQKFTMFPSNVGFNDGLSPAKPDFIEAYVANTFKPYPLIRRLGCSAVPVPGGRPIALAHIAGEFNRLSGDMECAMCQAAYDAATLVYGRNQACLAMAKPDEAKFACVGTFVSNGDQVHISVHYATNHASAQAVYHHCPIFSDNFLLNHASFTLTRKHLRNLQEWAMENATSLKTDLVAHYEVSQARTRESPDQEISRPHYLGRGRGRKVG